MNIEVKGINGEAPIYILTAGEYEQAITNVKFMLCLVTNARSKNRQLFCYTGKELIDKFTFKPLQYRVELKK